MTPCSLVRELKTYRGNLIVSAEHEESIVLRKAVLGYMTSYTRGHIRENPKAYTVPSKKDNETKAGLSLYLEALIIPCVTVSS